MFALLLLLAMLYRTLEVSFSSTGTSTVSSLIAKESQDFHFPMGKKNILQEEVGFPGWDYIS